MPNEEPQNKSRVMRKGANRWNRIGDLLGEECATRLEDLCDTVGSHKARTIIRNSVNLALRDEQGRIKTG